MNKTLTTISNAILPLCICLVVGIGLLKRQDVFAVFAQGAKGGLGMSFRIIPTLVGMMVAVAVFKTAGGFDLLSTIISPLFTPLGIPPELLPLLIMRPFSGSGGLGVLAGLIGSFGPDSYIARVACIYYGSSETLFYVLSLYFGSVGVKKTRYTAVVALISDLFGLIIACLICRVW